jgi:hypothetical protein
MTIVFGRRRLIVTLDTAAQSGRLPRLPMAENASDAELARLKTISSAAEDRRRWEASAILYGGMRPR